MEPEDKALELDAWFSWALKACCIEDGLKEVNLVGAVVAEALVRDIVTVLAVVAVAIEAVQVPEIRGSK